MFWRLFCLFILLLVGAGFYGCSPVTELPQDEQKNPYYQAAKERLETRDFRGAIEAFEKAIQVNPNSVLAHYELALAYEQHEFDYAAAIYHYNKAIKLRPNGYPADNARERVRVCRQELAKAESIAPIVPSLPLQFERLKDENVRLTREVEALRAQLAARSGASAGRASPSDRDPASPARPSGTPARTDTSPAFGSIASATRSAAAPTRGSGRIHRVQPGETLSYIARLYQVKLEALLAANPSVSPRRLQVGQPVTIPTP
jgi:LysM repeat protein